MKKLRRVCFIIAGIAAGILASHAMGQAWPAKPIHLVVAFTAGSATDIIARAVGDTLSKSLGQPVVIDNRPGAGGTIAAASVAKADPDGYTFLIHSAGHAVNPAIYPNLPYDTAKDFSGVSPLANLPNVLVVPPGRYKNVQEIVSAARANPGKLNFGSAGNGSATHMNAEKFRASAGFDALHIPFKGTPEALSETMSGRLDFFFAPIVSALQLIREGKLTALAVGTPKRVALLPENWGNNLAQIPVSSCFCRISSDPCEDAVFPAPDWCAAPIEGIPDQLPPLSRCVFPRLGEKPRGFHSGTKAKSIWHYF